MAINRFDQPAQAHFLNTYVPIPFEQIAQAGAQKQQEYNIGQAAIDNMVDEASSLTYIPTTEDERYIKEHVIPTMKEISDNYTGKDYGNPEVKRQFVKEIRQKIDHNRVKDIQRSAAKWEEAEKIKAGMLAKGEVPFNPFDYRGYDSRQGVYTETPTKTLDYERALEDFFDNVGEEFLSIGQQDGYDLEYHGRSLGKLQEYAKNNTRVAAANPAIRQLLESNGVDPDNLEGVKSFLLNKAPMYKSSRARVIGESKRGGDSDLSSFTNPFITPELKYQGTEATEYEESKDVYKAALEKEEEIKKLESGIAAAVENDDIETATVLQKQQNQLKESKELELLNATREKFKKEHSEVFDTFSERIVQNSPLNSKEAKQFTSYLQEKTFMDELPMTSLYDVKQSLRLSGVELKKLSEEDYEAIRRLYNKEKDKFRKLRKDTKKNIEFDPNTQERVAPLLIDDNGKIALPGTNSSINSKFKNTMESMDFDPSDYEIEIFNRNGISRKTRNNEVDDLRKGEYDKLHYGDVGINDDGKVYVTVKTEKEKTDGLTSYKSENKYKVFIPPTNKGQIEALSSDFLDRGDAYNYLNITNSDIEAGLQKAFKLSSPTGEHKLNDNVTIVEAKEKNASNESMYYLKSGGRLSSNTYNREGIKRVMLLERALQDQNILNKLEAPKYYETLRKSGASEQDAKEATTQYITARLRETLYTQF